MKSIKWIIAIVSTSLLFNSLPTYSSENLSKAAQTAVVQQTVDINHANAETLAERLKGIGLKRALAIVEYRKTNGSFKSVDELLNVKGVGASTIKANRNLIKL